MRGGRQPVILWSVVGAAVAAFGIANAADCHPDQGVVFGFDAAVPSITTATVKGVEPDANKAGRFRAQGTVQLRSGASVPVDVSIRYRAVPDQRIAYRVRSLKGAAIRVRGSLTTGQCQAGVLKVRLSLSGGRGMPSLRLKDPTLVSVLAIAMPETLIVDVMNVGGLTVSPADPSILRIPSGDPLAALVAPGRVIVAGLTPATPKGLLATVLDVEADGTFIVAHTKPASLDDAFESLDVDIGDPPAAMRVPASPRVRFELEPQALHFDQEIGPVSVDDAFGHAIELGGAFHLEADLSLGLHTGHKFRFIPTLKSAHAELHGTLSAEMHGHADSEASLSRSLVETPKIPIPPGVIPIGPIVLTPTFSIVAGVEVETGGEVSIGGAVSVESLIGFTCHGTDCSPESDFVFKACGDVEVSRRGSFKPYVGGEFAVLVNDIAGPTITPELFFKVEADQAADPWWKVSYGLDAEAALSIDLKLVDFEPFSHTFEILPVELFAADGPFDGNDGDRRGNCETTTTTVVTSSTTSTTLPLHKPCPLAPREVSASGHVNSRETSAPIIVDLAPCEQMTVNVQTVSHDWGGAAVALDISTSVGGGYDGTTWLSPGPPSHDGEAALGGLRAVGQTWEASRPFALQMGSLINFFDYTLIAHIEPRPGYNDAGESVGDARSIVAPSTVKGSLRSGDPGHFYRVHLGPLEELPIVGQFERWGFYDAIARIDVYDANGLLITERLMFAIVNGTHGGTQHSASTSFKNPSPVAADFIFRLGAESDHLENYWLCFGGAPCTPDV